MKEPGSLSHFRTRCCSVKFQRLFHSNSFRVLLKARLKFGRQSWFLNFSTTCIWLQFIANQVRFGPVG